MKSTLSDGSNFARSASRKDCISARPPLRGHSMSGVSGTCPTCAYSAGVRTSTIAAGDDQFTAMPNLPSPVHGVGGALYGNAFYLLGGSSLAAGIANLGAVQVLRW